MEIGRLADDGADRRTGVQQGLHAGIGGRRQALAAGHAEGTDLGVLQLQLVNLAKILEVLLVRERISSLDVVHAHLRQPLGDLQLVLERKADTLALRAVA